MVVFKKVMLNILVVLGIVLGAGFVCLAIMYFANINMFGLTVKKVAATQLVEVKTASYQSIIINNENILTSIIVNDTALATDEKIKITLVDKSQGLAPAKYSTLSLKTTDESGNLTITITCPKGIIFYGSSRLEVIIASELIDVADFQLISNTRNGHVSINTNEYENKEIKEVHSPSLLKLTSEGKGEFKIYSETKNVEIKTLSRNITFYKDIKGNVTFDTKNGDLYFENITGNVTVKATKGAYIYGDNIKQVLDYTGKGGKIEVDIIGEMNTTPDEDLGATVDAGYSSFYEYVYTGGLAVSTDNANIYVNYVVGRINIKTTYGDVNIKTLMTDNFYSDNSASTTKGKIKIGNAIVKNLNLATTKGSITASIGGASADEVNVSSVKGKITLTGKAYYANKVTRTAHTSSYKYDNTITSYTGTINVSSTESKITLNNISGEIIATSKTGEIVANIEDVVGESSIKTNGKITVKINKLDLFTLKLLANKKASSINLPSLATSQKIKKNTATEIVVGVGGTPVSTLTLNSYKKAIKVLEI